MNRISVFADGSVAVTNQQYTGAHYFKDQSLAARRMRAACALLTPSGATLWRTTYEMSEDEVKAILGDDDV